MSNRLRKFLLGVPFLTAVGLLALYLIFGFLALPAIVKWQIEKQVPEKLGHPISLGEVRFNPLVFKFEVGDLVLSDAEGRPMLGFKRLLVDFELRSVIDRAWTFAQATLEAPVLRVELNQDGRHNFTSMLERLRASEPEKEAGAIPRFIVQRVVLSDGRIEYSDRVLDEPLIARIEPLRIVIDDFSTLPERQARYQLSAQTGAGEALETSGNLALNPVASKGKLALNGMQVTTLARGLSRLIALDAPAGKMDLTANFDLAVDQNGTISGSVQDFGLDVAALSVSAPGGSVPVAAVETLSLKQGRVDLAKREAAFAELRLAKGGVSASVDEAGRIDWEKLMRVSEPPPQKAAAVPPPAEHSAIASKPWRVSLASGEISGIAVRYTDAPRGHSANIAALGLDLSASAEFGGPAGTRVELDKPKLSISEARLERGAESLGMPGALVEAGRVAFTVANRGFDLALDAPRVAAPNGLTAKQGDAALEVRSATVKSGRVALDGAGVVIKGAIDDPKISLAGVSVSRPAEAVQLRDLSLEGKRLALQLGPKGFDVGFEQLRSTLAVLQMRSGEDSIELGSATIAGEQLSLAQAEGPLRVAGSGAQVSVSDLAAKNATSELGRIAGANVGAKALVIALSDGPVDARGDGLTAALSDGVIRSPADATELLRLGSATLSGGVLRSGDRLVSIEKVALANGKAHTALDAQGKFNWLSLIHGEARPDAVVDKSQQLAAHAAVTVSPSPPSVPIAAEGEAAESARQQASSATWRFAVKSADLDGFSVGFEDRRASPAFGVGIDAMRVRVAGLDTGSATPMQVDFQAQVASGGEIQASGNVRADNGTSDVKITIAGIALAPVQTYLSELAELRLTSGTVSSAGRLRYGDEAGAGARLAYEGSVAVDRVLLEEVESKRPFLAWNSVASSDLVLTLEPNRLDIGELKVDGPSGRFIIAEDQTTNLMDVLKKPKESGDAQKSAKSASAEPSEPSDQTFPVTVARVRVSGGALEFADLSLRPQFGTRMHELKGVITGLGTDPDGSAKLQLDAQVDKFGLAKIGGQISVHQPERFTEVDMVFRNLEMTSLSPYVAKFAGYKIASGRLDLDLLYKVRSSKLLGENKIVLKEVALGEKVESPDALDLPLELAIAILKDADGVIDVGLPVRGDLNDPKFDYGEIIGKAFGNLVGGIVTAPFRALGAMFGGGAKQLGMIDFEPGNDALAPPERQKLEAVARALKERPALKLVVPPTYAAEEDTPALKTRAVRTDIVKRMGVELAPGEDPGPIDAANPRVQRAVEAAFTQRYAPEVLAVLKRRALEAAASTDQSAAPAGKSAQELPRAEGKPAATSATKSAMQTPGLPPAFYQSLVDRLIFEQPVSEQTLAQLATRRGEAIVREITALGGVPAARVVVGEPHKATDANDKVVTLRLELEVAK